MSEPFLAEIKIVAFNFAPRGWALCDGQILPINQNQSLYSLIGTTYGGDGRTTFALPDLRGRTPFHFGDGITLAITLGQKGGEQSHSLTMNEMPGHDHALQASSTAGTQPIANANILARSVSQVYLNPKNLGDMQSTSVGNVGTGQAHENMSPFLALNFAIALVGLFPSRN